MKRNSKIPLFTITALCVCGITAPSFAGDNPAGTTAESPQGHWLGNIEVETERVKVSGGDNFRADTLAFIFGYRIGPDKFDLKLEQGKDHDAAAESGGKLELRYRRYFPQIGGLKPNVRFGIGEYIKSGSGASFGYYTVEPSWRLA